MNHLDDALVGSFLFLRLIEDVDAPARLVRSVRNIVPPSALMLIREVLNRLDIFLIKLDLLEVLGNASRRHRFGNHRVAANLAPSQDNLSGGGTLLLSDGLDFRACDQQGNVEEVVAERRVGGDVDVLLLGIGDELVAREDRVALDLVHGRDDAGLVDKLLESLCGEVGDTSRASFALGQSVYGLPCFTVGDRVVDVDLVGVRGSWKEIRVRVLAGAEVYRPVDEVEVLHAS